MKYNKAREVHLNTMSTIGDNECAEVKVSKHSIIGRSLSSRNTDFSLPTIDHHKVSVVKTQQICRRCGSIKFGVSTISILFFHTFPESTLFGAQWSSVHFFTAFRRKQQLTKDPKRGL